MLNSCTLDTANVIAKFQFYLRNIDNIFWENRTYWFLMSLKGKISFVITVSYTVFTMHNLA